MEPASITIDLPCIACGYNLRTLRADGVCPECAKPVRDSMRPDDLRLAHPKWLRRVRCGITWLLIIGGVWLVLGGLVPFAILLLKAQRAADMLVSIAAFGVTVLYLNVLVAVSLMLSEDPRQSGPTVSGRLIARTLLGVSCLIYAMQFLVDQAEVLPYAVLPYALHVLHAVTAGVAFSLALLYLQGLATRGNAARLVYWLSIVLFGAVLLAAEHAITAGIVAYKVTVGDTDYSAADRVQTAIAPTSLAVMILGMIVLLRYRSLLTRHIAVHEQ